MILATPDQLDSLNRLLALAWERSAFYRRKWRAVGLSAGTLRSLDELERFPLTTRAELQLDQANHPPLGTNLTVPFSDCIRLHRSSGTTRAPLYWADDVLSWQAVIRCSQALWEWAGVNRGDRVFLAMPFGTSSGPWIMQAGAQQLGCLCFTAGAASRAEQWEWIRRFQPTVLAGKPETLLALAAVAEAAGVSAPSVGVRKLICGGAPGAHVPGTRSELERSWAAECFDRYGLTEAGSVAGECGSRSGGLHLVDRALIAEAVALNSVEPASDACLSELVLTNLTRTACPLVRYRTGDLVQLDGGTRCPCGLPGARLIRGVHRAAAPRGA